MEVLFNRVYIVWDCGKYWDCYTFPSETDMGMSINARDPDYFVFLDPHDRWCGREEIWPGQRVPSFNWFVSYRKRFEYN